MQRRIKRPLLDAQDIFGAPLDRFRDPVAVRGPEQKRLEYE
jgi:hypothetical protein